MCHQLRLLQPPAFVFFFGPVFWVASISVRSAKVLLEPQIRSGDHNMVDDGSPRPPTSSEAAISHVVSMLWVYVGGKLQGGCLWCRTRLPSMLFMSLHRRYQASNVCMFSPIVLGALPSLGILSSIVQLDIASLQVLEFICLPLFFGQMS